MKTLIKNLEFLLLLMAMTFLVACSSNSDEVQPEPSPEPEPDNTEETYVLQDDVVEIKSDNFKNIIGTSDDGTTLTLSASYPSDEMPVIGQIVFVHPDANGLAHGFLGKVTSINPSDGGYALTTESVPLDEAFSYLDIDETIVLEPSSQDARVTNSEEDGYKCISQEVAVKVKLSEVRKVEATGNLKIGARIRCRVKVDALNKVNYQRIEFSTLGACELSCHLLYGRENEKLITEELPFGLKIPAGVVSFFATPQLTPKIVCKMEANAKLGLYKQFEWQRTIAVEYVDGKWYMDHYTENSATKEPGINLLPEADVALEGSVFVGVGISPEIRLFNRPDVKAELNPAFGVKGSAEISYNSGAGCSLYEALKDDCFKASLALVLEAKAEAKIFNKYDVEWSADLLDVDLGTLGEKYIFLEFVDSRVVKSKVGNSYTATVNTTLQRDLLFETPVGIAVYDDADNILYKSDTYAYKNFKDFADNNPLKAVFEELPDPEKESYGIYSYFLWGNTILKGAPIRNEYKQLKKLSVHDFSYGEKTEYTFTYNDAGQLTQIEEILKYERVVENTHYDLEYSGTESVSVDVTRTYVDGESNRYRLDMTLNSEGYITHCNQTFSDGEVDTWEYTYNEDGRMICMKRSEGNETWTITYSNGDAVKTHMEGGDESGSHTISYNAEDNKSMAVLHEYMYGIDIDEMEVYGLVGMLGKPSRHLPTVWKGDERSYTSSWETDTDGHPVRLVSVEDEMVTEYTFTWE